MMLKMYFSSYSLEFAFNDISIFKKNVCQELSICYVNFKIHFLNTTCAYLSVKNMMVLRKRCSNECKYL